jgi:ABC-type branched-subunit amino acid transport system ATPase component
LQFSREGIWAYVKSFFPEKKHQFVDFGSLTPVVRQQATSPLLDVKAIRKQFGGLVAVNDVSFTLDKAKVVALIGPNGAGKSTSFNLLTGLLKATSGHAYFNGVEMKNVSPQLAAQQGIGRTFQHVQLIPTMSLLENVALGAHLRGKAGIFASLLRLNKQEEAQIFQEAKAQITRVGLGEFIDKSAGSLALGQQRIAEIARALCLNPSLLLLDEPAAGLRFHEKEKLAALLTSLRDEGLSVLIVEHDMKFVMGLVDKIVVLDFGTKIAEGTPQEIRTNPAVLAAYLGAH